MSKDSANFEGVLSVRGSNTGNLAFEDDVDLTGGMTKLASTAMIYSMEMRTKKKQNKKRQSNDNEDYWH